MYKTGQTDKKTDRKKRRAVANLEISNTVCWQCWSLRYVVYVLFLCGGCHPEGLIVSSLIKFKKISKTMRKIFQKEKK